jgi:hypothetical protein
MNVAAFSKPIVGDASSLSGRRRRTHQPPLKRRSNRPRSSRLFRMNVRMPGHVYGDNAISPHTPHTPAHPVQTIRLMEGRAHPLTRQQNGADTAVGARGGLLPVQLHRARRRHSVSVWSRECNARQIQMSQLTHVAQLFKKFPKFYGTRRFITVSS